MQQLKKDIATNTVLVWPEVTSSYASLPVDERRYLISLTQDFDESNTQFTASLINSPNAFNPRLILQFTGSALPDWSGLYGFELVESLLESKKWGEAHTKWNLTHIKWSERAFPTASIVLDTDRAFVSGSDTITFNQYVTSSTEVIYESGSAIDPPTQYTGSDQTGQYTTYH